MYSKHMLRLLEFRSCVPDGAGWLTNFRHPKADMGKSWIDWMLATIAASMQ